MKIPKFTPPEDDQTATIVERIDQMLDALLIGGPLTLTQLSNATDIPRSTCHRILMKMLRMKWACRIGNKYEIGTRMFALGTAAVRTHWFHRLALPHLDSLQKKTGFIVHLGYLEESTFVVWEKLWGNFGAQLPTRVGSRLGAHATAAGKVLLAQNVEQWCETERVLHRYTPKTFESTQGMHRELEEIRERGIAVDRGELLVGVGCMATTVEASPQTTDGGVAMTAAISVCAPVQAIQANKDCERFLQETARRITREALCWTDS